ncbi:hypothetical protein BU14_0445s0021 [Porphyra umbilicalis]|uniref:Uncharacterized protein n=1 Tax=Porphyra umbilicalis TaxID=2786 RepID=A0A1X6NUN5_PORUM|nr:hypothetical protein BU14_0445s0021 [Porphyra umbilicalis]|eukprot:OSX72339.1 hypothetical protein BU14_0445s0021 [Porphyra umbilicalis]
MEGRRPRGPRPHRRGPWASPAPTAGTAPPPPPPPTKAAGWPADAPRARPSTAPSSPAPGAPTGGVVARGRPAPRPPGSAAAARKASATRPTPCGGIDGNGTRGGTCGGGGVGAPAAVSRRLS